MSNRIDASPLSADSAERLDRLFRLYSRPVLALAARRAKRPEDADDIAAETWLKVCRVISTLRADDERAMPWLASAVRTVAIDFYRPKRQAEQASDWTDAVASRQLPAAPAADVDTDVFALADLTANQAVCLKLAAQGLSHGRIAARIGRSHGAVYSHIHRGARKVRRSLELAG
uniref:RNA polymerase sigma factor SigS n=1 Tax=Streptomyces sp. 44414 TaxID=364103 RepID=Q2LEU6_9ACTN|nr:sigma-70 family RNA polymerase sigma factor [Streptomyces sp. 44414]ABC67369.1 pRL2-6 [Streptomyces sp. 44414]